MSFVQTWSVAACRIRSALGLNAGYNSCKSMSLKGLGAGDAIDNRKPHNSSESPHTKVRESGENIDDCIR